MSAQGSEAVLAQPQSAPISPLGELVLVRVSAEGGATRSETITDLQSLFAHKLSPGEWRRVAEQQIGHLIAVGCATEARARLRATDRGLATATRFLGALAAGMTDWTRTRDVALVAKGLGLEKEPQSRLRGLARPEGLRALILQQAFKLPGKKNPSPAKLRAQLALVALERAFGNKVKTGLGKGSAFTAKAGRTLAGQLSVNPRDFGTDQRLIAELAAESVGSVQHDIDALRTAILKRLGTRLLAAQAAAEPKVVTSVPRAPIAPANDTEPQAELPLASNRPGLAEFARGVKRAARGTAEGWPGNRKAFISRVWQAIRVSEPVWGLTEIEFKCMLAEAHRAGALVLANADLKDKNRIKEIESSAIAYKNMVWHFVRVED